MSRPFFTSDTHFGHGNVIRHAGRPFADADEMDAAMITNWNAAVTPSDRVYHLGDFSFHKAERTAEIIRSLNGQIHLIRGNHDRVLDGLRHLFASFQDYKEIKVTLASGETQRVVMLHYALRVWNRSHHGAWHLYGHSHGTLPDDPFARSMDVGVDPNGFVPLSVEQIAEHMSRKSYRSVDHHTPERV